MLSDRNTAKPISSQIESFPDGQFIYRHALLRLDEESVSAAIGACFDDNGWTTKAIPPTASTISSVDALGQR
ncbi:MAG: hypothetical protein ACI4X9_03970 [Kiritimatiellia bacterium]